MINGRLVKHKRHKVVKKISFAKTDTDHRNKEMGKRERRDIYERKGQELRQGYHYSCKDEISIKRSPISSFKESDRIS